MTGTVWTKFYWPDWESDEALRLCSLSAQGLWMRMLCLAAKADPTGYVTVNGRPLGVTDIARLAGVTETECESLLSELDRNGVFSRTRNGTIYSRRMVRDAKRSKTAQKNGKTGGNPTLRKKRGISGWDNPPLNPGLNTHKPYANSHIPVDDDKSSSAGARDSPGFDEVDQALRAIPGIDRHPCFANPVTAPVWQLAAKGYGLKAHILPSIARQVAAARKPIAAWGYFVPGIIADATGPPAAPAAVIPFQPHGAAHATRQPKPSRDEIFAELHRRIDAYEAAERQANGSADADGGGNRVDPAQGQAGNRT